MIWSVVTSRTIWSGLEIAPGVSAVRGTVTCFSMWPETIAAPVVPDGMSVAATSTPTEFWPCCTCFR